MTPLPQRLDRRSTLQYIGLAALGASPLAGMAQSIIKVASVYSVPVEQQWASRIHVALLAAQKRGDIEYSWVESVPTNDAERALRSAASKANLVIADAFALEKPARALAKAFPKTAFLMGSSFEPTEPNYSVFDNHIADSAYLCGLVAGSLTKANVIGMVGGYPIPEVNRIMNAFMDGATEVNPRCRFLVSFIGSWFDPPKAKEAAFAQIDAKADVLYAERTGVADAARTRKILAIGNLVNTQADFPDTMVTAALWHMEPTIDKVIANLKAGTFKAEDYGKLSTMKFGGAKMAPFGTFESKVPQPVKDLVRAKEAAIMAGSFVVKVKDQEPKSTLRR